MTALGSHTVTIVRQPGADAFGDPQGAVTEIDEPGWFVQPETSAEQTDQRDTVTTVRVAFIPAGSDIRPTDRVRWNGNLYQVDGEPAFWDDIHAQPHHIEARLRRVEG